MWHTSKWQLSANGSCQTHFAAWPCGTGRNRSVIFKRGQKGVSLFCIIVYTIDSKGHLQARKKGKAEQLQKNCGKLR